MFGVPDEEPKAGPSNAALSRPDIVMIPVIVTAIKIH